VRLFVAINLPPDVRSATWAAAEPLRAAVPGGISWVREEALHVTLRFLGEHPASVADDLAARLAPLLAGVSPPRIELATVGAFPDLRRPRVLWIGGPSNSALAELYQGVQRACSSIGFDPEPRPFRLHVTVGRVRQGARLDGEPLARAAAGVRLDVAFTAATVDVMESELSQAGSRYRVVAAVPIGSRG
jgi:2'-5' RNA ligase